MADRGLSEDSSLFQGIQLCFRVPQGESLERVLQAELQQQGVELSLVKIKDAMQKGALWLEPATRNDDKCALNRLSSQKIRQVRRKSAKVNPHDQLHFYYHAALLNSEALRPTLIDDCGRFSVWDKPSGMPVQGSKWGDHTALARVVETQHLSGSKSYLVHRLDRWASGLIVLAHDKPTAAALAALFAQRAVDKRYRALAYAAKFDSLDSRLMSATGYRMTQAIETKPAVSVIKSLLGSNPKAAKHLLNPSQTLEQSQNIDTNLLDHCVPLEIAIETGRKHQIRRHCAALGLPLVGDRQYGDPKQLQQWPAINLQLRAVQLAFTLAEQSYTWCLAD